VDIVGRPFQRLCAGKSDERRLRRRVQNHVAAAAMTGPRRNVDHLAGTARQHVRPDRARAQQRLRQVDVHDEAQFRVREGRAAILFPGQRRQRLADRIAERIHQHIDAAEGLEHGIHGVANLVRVGHIGDDRHDPSARRLGDLGRHALDIGGVSALSAMSPPASASTVAMPLPMPRPAPVMKTIFPAMSNSLGSIVASVVLWSLIILERTAEKN
jgi:hypothetical protein